MRLPILKKISTIFLLSIIFAFMGCNDSTCIDTNCDDYATQADAQAAYDADPDCRGDLDADGDGKACEHLANCPTTSDCGCSDLDKTTCENNICCKWVVGSGCECD